ncbi:MAG: hypothetical protein IKR74_02400 [Bacilli bacterium]|nr:hypothetical protein [Bacilli bacterium]
MNKNNIVLLTITIIMLLSLITFATYAFFNIGDLNVTNVANITATSERNNSVFDTFGGEMSLNVTRAVMAQANKNTLAASNTTTLTVNFTGNSTSKFTCTYDIIYEWTSSNKYTAHTATVAANEFTIQATLASNTHVNEGINYIKNETDLSVAVNTLTSSTVVKGAQIDSTGSSTSTAVWTLTSKFYNVNANQNSLADKNYQGRFKVDNVVCKGESLSTTNTLVKYLVNTAAKSGTSSVGSKVWKLVMDHPREFRYIGANPNNYITFNGELWRIVGIIPNVEYCTGTFTDTTCSASETGDLVKIVRNASEGTMAFNTSSTNSNKWDTSSTTSIAYTLQSKTYASDSHVAVVKWSTTGYSSASRTPAQFYALEYQSTGAVPSGYSKFWYGKVGSIHVSDYSYATLGNNAATGTYTRTGCLARALPNWTSSYKTNCALTSWLSFNNVTSSLPSAGVAWWTMAPVSGAKTNVIDITTAGITSSIAATTATINVRPAVYLKPDTLVSGTHTGAYNDPLVIG